MKMLKMMMVCAALAAPAALYAAEEKADEPAAVSTAAAPSHSGWVGMVTGYRGVSISAPGDQLLYVKKGDRVDLLVTFESPADEGGKELVTASILQNVIVTNVNRPAKTAETGAIELLLSPTEAQYAALSVAQGKKINIVVRAPGDVELHPMEMASFRKLIK